jgi:hypothetical protein
MSRRFFNNNDTKYPGVTAEQIPGENSTIASNCRESGGAGVHFCFFQGKKGTSDWKG